MKRFVFLVITIILGSLNTFSQSVGVTDFMRLNPYSSFNNPAYFVPYSSYVGIPGVSNFNFSLYNSSFIYKNLIETKKRTPLKWTPNKFVNSLSKNNWFNTELNLEILGCGFRIQKYFFSFSYRVKMNERFRYSKDLFGFVLQGNLAQNNHGEYLYTADHPALIEIAPNINLYQEMSFGFQGEISDQLYIGVRPKILWGLLNLKTETFNAKIYSNPNDYTIYGNYNISINTSTLFPLYTKDANGELRFDMDNLAWWGVKNCFSKNLGFAIDLGAMYRINQQIRVAASVTDLGFIRWKVSPLNINIKPLSDEEYAMFEGFTYDQIENFIYNGMTMNFDSITNDFINNNFVLNELKAYNTMLTSKIMLEGYFDLTSSTRFILQLKGYIMGKAFLPQFTIAYNGTFFNAIDIVVSYSMMKKSFANLGLGVGFRAGPFHIYAGTDNVWAAINVFNAKKMNITFGMLVDLPFREKVKEAELKSLFMK